MRFLLNAADRSSFTQAIESLHSFHAHLNVFRKDELHPHQTEGKNLYLIKICPWCTQVYFPSHQCSLLRQSLEWLPDACKQMRWCTCFETELWKTGKEDLRERQMTQRFHHLTFTHWFWVFFPLFLNTF